MSEPSAAGGPKSEAAGATEASAAGATLWLTGLSGAGKSTVAGELSLLLEARGVPAAGSSPGNVPESILGRRGLRRLTLDGDDLREGLNADLGFGAEDRAENVRRVGEVALLFARHGHLVLVSVISPYAADREKVRKRHEASGVAFVEVHVATPLDVCEARDPKGLYGRARAGEIQRFTGVSDPYEPPTAPEVRLSTEGRSPAESAAELLVALDRLGLLGGAAPAGSR